MYTEKVSQLILCALLISILLPSALGAQGTSTGDANGDAAVDIADPVYILNYLFSGGPPPVPCGPPANTLDNAYNQGGPGAGRLINADAGAVSIEGPDGLSVGDGNRVRLLEAAFGMLQTFGDNGTLNLTLGANPASANFGEFSAHDDAGNARSTMTVNPATNAGELHLYGADGLPDVTMNAGTPRVAVYNNTGLERGYLDVAAAGGGRAVTLGPNGFKNAELGSAGGDPDLGAVRVFDATGLATVVVEATASDDGRITTFGPNGTANCRMTVAAANGSRGKIEVLNENEALRGELGCDSANAGYAHTYGNNGSVNGTMTTLSTDPNKGWIGIADNNGTYQAMMFVDAAGMGVISADVKNFRMPHPEEPDKEIWYACPEGPEAAVYWRGTAQLVNGSARVELPDHFRVVATEAGMTVHVTPTSPESCGLAVVGKSLAGIEVRELARGTGSYEFDINVMAVRKGFENYEVIRSEDYWRPTPIEPAADEQQEPAPHGASSERTERHAQFRQGG